MNDENARLRAAIDSLRVPIYTKGLDGRYVYANDLACALLKRSRPEVIGKRDHDLFPPALADVMRQNDLQAISHGQPVIVEEFVRLPGVSEPHCCLSIKQPLFDAAGEVDGVAGLTIDISGSKRMEQMLQEQQSLLRAIVDNTPVEYWARDLDGRCIMQNAMTAAHWGNLLGKWPENADPAVKDEWEESNRRAYAGETVQKEVEYLVGDEMRVYQCLVAPIRVEGEVVGIFGFNQDITERKRHEQQIHELAFFDPLTRLPNRRLMYDRLEHALGSSARRQHEGALLLIDLDHFKELNDTHGHEAGDQLLMKAAARLNLSIRPGDTAARLGGDEFVVILEDLEGVADGLLHANTIAQRISAELSRPFHLLRGKGGETITHQCSASIGISAFGGADVSAAELLRRADTAMYQAKAAGRNAVCFFDPAMQAAVTERATLHSDLRQAIRTGQFVLHYQVQMDANRRPSGAEVLLRWQHPHKGLLYPAAFIDLAEETGLIVPLGYWVLETACTQLAQWAARPEMAHLRLAVNVSARQFHQPAFADQVRELLQRTGAPADRLKLELTESTLIEDAECVIEHMACLRALGIRFSLDDFGTGYSSLAYLKRLPLTQLKIDQSFVRDVLSDPNDATIVRTILALGNSFGLSVIAEGVETEAQCAFLAENGCRDYQGYLFSRPVPLVDFESMLKS